MVFVISEVNVDLAYDYGYRLNDKTKFTIILVIEAYRIATE
jgi:hypothetical protein